jgi:hypothetical protein
MPIEFGHAIDKYLEKLYERPDIFVRKMKKSNYTELIEEYNKQVCKWTDPDFPPNDHSFGNIQGIGRVYWKRASEIISNPSFIGGKIDPANILINEANGGYFISSIAAFAESDHRTYREVVVDDFVPCDQQGNPLFVSPINKEEIWLMILYKCFAKLHGSYAATISNFYLTKTNFLTKFFM